MNDLTISELLFEQFCEDNSIPYSRIGQAKDKTPDYDVYFGEHHIIAEVKQTDQNEKEENEYAESHDDLPVTLYLFVGSLEARQRVSNLYDILAARQYPGLKMEMDILEGDTHFTVIPGATFKGLISVFGK